MSFYVKVRYVVLDRVVDLHRFNADPDPAFFLITDPDPVPDPGFS
jgi:hypothetical protein